MQITFSLDDLRSKSPPFLSAKICRLRIIWPYLDMQLTIRETYVLLSHDRRMTNSLKGSLEHNSIPISLSMRKGRTTYFSRFCHCALVKIYFNIKQCFYILQWVAPQASSNSEISIGNHMISSAIWDKSARVNFSKANNLWSLKNLQVLIYPKLHERNHVITC